MARSFFRVGLSMGFSKLGILGQMPLFKCCLRGAAPMPLALPYPFCTSPWTCTGARGDKQEKATILYFGLYSRAFLWILTKGEGVTIKHWKTDRNWHIIFPDNASFLAASKRLPYRTTAVLLPYDRSLRSSCNRWPWHVRSRQLSFTANDS